MLGMINRGSVTFTRGSWYKMGRIGLLGAAVVATAATFFLFLGPQVSGPPASDPADGGERASVAAVAAAHTEGARVTAHAFCEDSLPGLIKAGIDCIEHGTGLTEDTVTLMVEHGTALVPTLINIESFPGFADAAGKYPRYAAHMRALYASSRARIGAAREAGVPIFAGSDAGASIEHGRIGDEVEALKGIGMTPTEALGAACWDARTWLGRQALVDGETADLLCFTEDPRTGPGVLSRPDRVVLRGRVYRGWGY